MRKNMWFQMMIDDFREGELLADTVTGCGSMRKHPLYEEYPWEQDQNMQMWKEIDFTCMQDPAVQKSFDSLDERIRNEMSDNRSY